MTCSDVHNRVSQEGLAPSSGHLRLAALPAPPSGKHLHMVSVGQVALACTSVPVRLLQVQLFCILPRLLWMSVACRQSLPPHAPAQSCGPGVTVTRKVYTPGASHGRAETSLSKRTAYSEVLRRVRSAHGTPTPVNAQQHSSPVEPLGPWSE